ncbi:MAG: LON peptidase substrate-binding domain-containing protein [Gammaproteobacteria bacterium]|nr:LON peptidase substrate-binding domain-containing protein [Gammaproteobacteria bacterium]MCY4282422.1 LON peptidase substrate-binding domain-containing protein [Gammaproteobacteria bacterium]MCY4338616.1 LON peptidase substrate-binding domain-containing protein [Gammaproteobacteria bacterium]
MQNIPLFPLNTVLYPHGRMPLRIFEPRYLDMVSECMKTSSGFGVCLIRKGAETGSSATCFDIGTYAEIIDFSPQADGLLGITVQGKRRFKVLQTARRDNNLLTGEIAWVTAEQSGAYPEEYGQLKDLYLHLVENYETLYNHEDHASVSPMLVSYRLAEFLPFAKDAKQELLETDDAAARLELIKTGLMSLEAEIEDAIARA